MPKAIRVVVCLVVSVFCYAVALALTAGWLHGGNADAWMAGGALSFTVASLLYVLPIP